MLRYLKHHEIDYNLWDACLQEAPNGLLYGLSWYLDIVSPGWHAIVKEVDGKYAAVMPLPVRKKFGISYLQQPILTQQLGIFYREPLLSTEWQEIGQRLKQRFRIVNRYTFNTGNSQIQIEGLSEFVWQHYATYHLDLNQPYKNIFSGYKKNRKWRVNQAKNNKLQNRPAENVDLLFQLFEENTANKIYGLTGEGYTYKLVKELYTKAKETNTGEIYEVRNAQQETLAMAFFTFFNKKIIYLFSTTTAEGKKVGAIPFLLDSIIAKYAGSDFTFDFEAPRPGGPGAKPIIDFYESFGPEKVEFLAVSLDNLPLPLKWVKKLRMQLYQAFLQK